MMSIPITKPFIDNCEKEAVIKVLESGWLVQGKYVAEFEKLFSDFTNSRFAKATSNCTTALHLGLDAMGIGKGDRVIVPSFTYVASANAVEYTGAEVVFCDININTFNIDENKIEDLIVKDSSIRAIMPVNLFGLCANLPYIMEISRKYGLKVIEDSACGFDAWIGDKHSGTFGDCGCFSFHPRKSITTGEGGMIITDNKDIADKTAQLRDHGADKSDYQRHEGNSGSLLPDFTLKGYNYRITDIQGAIGICQMQKKVDIMEKRRNIAIKYLKDLKEIEELKTPYVPNNYIHGYQSFVCLFTNGANIENITKKQIDEINIKRNIFMEKLEKLGVSTRQGTHAVHTLTYYKNKYNIKDEDFLMSYAADRLSIAFPLYPSINAEEYNYIINCIKKTLKQ